MHHQRQRLYWGAERVSDSRNDATEANSQMSGKTKCMKLPGIVQVCAYPTPRAGCQEGYETRNARKGHVSAMSYLESCVEYAITPWMTASARDWKDTPGMATTGTNPDGTTRTRLDQLPGGKQHNVSIK